MDELKREVELLERNRLERQVKELREEVEQLDQDQEKEKWRRQAIEDNLRQALQQNNQFSTYFQGQIQQEPSKFSFCENCGDNGHTVFECEIGMNCYERPGYEMSYTTNCYNQPFDYQLQNEHEYGWNDHNDFSHWEYQESGSNSNANNAQPNSNLENMLQAFMESQKQGMQALRNQVDLLTTQTKLLRTLVAQREHELKTQINYEDCDNNCSFNTTQVSFETNDNGEKEYALVFVGEDEMEQLNESTTILDSAPKIDDQTLERNPNSLSKDEPIPSLSFYLDASDCTSRQMSNGSFLLVQNEAYLANLHYCTRSVSYKHHWKNYDAFAGRKVKVKRDVMIRALHHPHLHPLTL
jgi:hypothetical protein